MFDEISKMLDTEFGQVWEGIARVNTYPEMWHRSPGVSLRRVEIPRVSQGKGASGYFYPKA
jgi:hypothetical protein